ncbi:MFS transporter [Aspergillus ruber CBS 135680]|uniref:Putative MFS multidrug transporter n=1 Tax=Aspergillus ruber (strain CBS 135680) TaxID=1388766 RepID=A0A017SN28_ASPRC|nr:putative MFS multidrug transporter [Aspergillus ruber CBS 135680]EYE97665.1 putative MFS multidrug transporter [Aspergillus ruber CBS 135680]
MTTKPTGEAPGPSKIPFWRTVWDQKILTDEVTNFPYDGSGTPEDPYAISWIPQDPRNPMNWGYVKKWSITFLASFITLAVSLVSSAYSGGISQIVTDFNASEEIAILGVSLFVLGFAFGPLIWAPLSETFGRRNIFIMTYGLMTAFNAGACGSQNIQTLIILRFFGGFFGSSPFGNSGGTIADMFASSERGIAVSMYSAAPFLGPCLGPIIGGFLGEAAGWRWVLGLLAAFTGVIWLVITFCLPETYAPVLLRRRAEKLSEVTGKVYQSRLDIDRGGVSTLQMLKTSLSRPWILLFREPIVLLSSIYMAIIYGTLYMLFAAYPIVFQEVRGWSQGIGGLAFVGVLVGMMIAFTYTLIDNLKYMKLAHKTTGRLPPEMRLPIGIVGAISLPIGLFWFAWTNSPSIHWLCSVAAGAPFGFGMVLVFLGVMNYLVDSYTIFAASVLAANSALRSLFGAIFPLFTTYMYHNLGIHWATCIPAFLAVACIPFPIIFYFYGPRIRKRCTYAAEADAFMQRLTMKHLAEAPHDEPANEKSAASNDAENNAGSGSDSDSDVAASLSTVPSSRRMTRSRAGSHASRQTIATQYEENPYNIDRVNTRHSAISGHRAKI